jgi:hypothetical protein
MFPTTITINNVSDLQKVMSVLHPTTGVVEITDTSHDVKGAAAPVEKLKGNPKATLVATTAKPAPSPATAEVGAATDAPVKTADASSPIAVLAEAAQQASTAATDGPAPAYKDAAEAVTTLSRKKGRDTAVGVLKSFGADKLPDVKSEDFAAVIAACRAALEG